MNYQLEKIKINLKVNWKIARNQSLFKENFILSSGEFASEVAPNIRYGETAKRIEKEFKDFVNNEYKLKESYCNSFKNAVVNLELKRASQGKIEIHLNLPEIKKIKTSFSIPIMEVSELEHYLASHPHLGIYKLKVGGLHDLPLLEKLHELTSASLRGARIRVDANEGFSSLASYLEFEQKIKHMNIEFIEQPFKASMVDEYIKLKPKSHFEIIADESVEDEFDAELFSKMFHGINVKLMKAGGIIRAKYILEQAKDHGLKTMLGCMIETSLGISEAFVLASLCDYFDLDGSLLISNDPYADLLFISSDQYLCLR